MELDAAGNLLAINACNQLHVSLALPYVCGLASAVIGDSTEQKISTLISDASQGGLLPASFGAKSAQQFQSMQYRLLCSALRMQATTAE